MSPDDPRELLKRYEPKALRALKPDRQLCTARCSPRGTLLAAGGTDATIRRWDLSAEAMPELAPMTGHGGWVQALAFDPDGTRLFSADSWAQLRCWPLDGDPPAPTWAVAEAHDGWIRQLAVS